MYGWVVNEDEERRGLRQEAGVCQSYFSFLVSGTGHLSRIVSNRLKPSRIISNCLHGVSNCLDSVSNYLDSVSDAIAKIWSIEYVAELRVELKQHAS